MFDDIFKRINDLKRQFGLEEPIHSPLPKDTGVKVIYPKDKPRAPIKMKVVASTPTPTVTPTQTARPQQIPRIDPEVQKFIENTVFPITRKYNLPDPVSAGMFAGEGRLSGLGADRNNFYNIRAFDSDPNKANYFATPEAGVEAFAKLLTTDKRYSKALEHINDPVKMLEAIQNAGYAGDPNTYEQRAKNNFKSYSEFIQAIPEFRYYQ